MHLTCLAFFYWQFSRLHVAFTETSSAIKKQDRWGENWWGIELGGGNQGKQERAVLCKCGSVEAEIKRGNKGKSELGGKVKEQRGKKVRHKATLRRQIIKTKEERKRINKRKQSRCAVDWMWKWNNQATVVARIPLCKDRKNIFIVFKYFLILYTMI